MSPEAKAGILTVALEMEGAKTAGRSWVGYRSKRTKTPDVYLSQRIPRRTQPLSSVLKARRAALSRDGEDEDEETAILSRPLHPGPFPSLPPLEHSRANQTSLVLLHFASSK